MQTNKEMILLRSVPFTKIILFIHHSAYEPSAHFVPGTGLGTGDVQQQVQSSCRDQLFVPTLSPAAEQEPRTTEISPLLPVALCAWHMVGTQIL